MKRNLLRILAAIIALAFVILCVYNIKAKLEKDAAQTREINSIQTEMNKIKIDLNSQDTQLKESKKDNEQLKKKREELEKKNQELQSKLQAKLDEKNRLAKASEAVINTATQTRTASATSGSDIKSIIVAAANKHGVDVGRALRIADCESSYNPNVINYHYTDPTTGTHPMGLFQHVQGYWAKRASDYGYAGASVFDPVANANVTMAMWADGQQGLWECQ